MNFSKLTDDVMMLFDKPVLDSPLFTTNVPDNILTLVAVMLKDEKFKLRTTYMKYILDEENHMVFLVIRKDNKDDYPARFLSDKVYLNGEKYGIIIMPESYYYTSRDEKIINMLNICARTSYLVLGTTTIVSTDFINGAELVNFFAPIVMGLTMIGCKFALYDEGVLEVTMNALNKIYGITLEKDWIDEIIADITEYGVRELLDSSIIYSESAIYISAVAKYSVKKKEEQNASV